MKAWQLILMVLLGAAIHAAGMSLLSLGVWVLVITGILGVIKWRLTSRSQKSS